MTATPHIAPAQLSLTVGEHLLSASEIRLGGYPRGACVVVLGGPPAAIDEVAVMNQLAVHGYESITIDSPAGPDAVDFIRAAVEHLTTRGRFVDNIGLVGLGAGGRSVLRVAATVSFGAAVSVSPTDDLSATAARDWLRDALVTTLRTPWLGLFAEPDGHAVGSDIGCFARALERNSPIHAHTVTYRHVDPDFYRNGDTGLAHAAAFDAWQRTVEWFNLQLAPTLTHLAKQALTT